MSFIAKSISSFFSFNKNNTQNPNQIKNNNNQNILKDLFVDYRNTKRKKIFTTSEEQKPGIFAAFINNQNQDNINNNNYNNNVFPRKSTINHNIHKIEKINDSTWGINFNGIGHIRSDNQNCIFMSITALPEYKYSSSEELRLADIEKKMTGNIKFYKINNILNQKNDFFSNDKSPNNKKNKFCFNDRNNIFNNNILNYEQSPLFRKNNNKDNIFANKLDNSNSPFVNLMNMNNKYSGISQNNIFSSSNNNTNKIGFINNKNLFSTNNPIKLNNNINKNFFQENPLFNPNQNIIDISSNGNNTFNKFTSEELDDPLYNLDINKLFSEKEIVSKVLINSMKKEQSVNDFILDLKKEYSSSESLNINKKESFNYEKKNLDNDNGITFSQKNFNKFYKDDFSYLSPIKMNNEVLCYNMEVERNENNTINNICNNNYEKPYSKIEQIYNDSEKSKNEFNRKNYLGNKTYKKAFENIETNKKVKLENDKYFSKTFSNGFTKFNIQNKKNGIFLGRDEELYKQNLIKFDELSLNEINNKVENENKFKIINNGKNGDDKLNILLNNDSYNKSDNKLNDSLSSISRQYVDIIIEYNLPENNNHYELSLRDVDQLMKVKLLKEDIIKRINIILQNKNYSNYSITKLTLLIPTEFLKDEESLIIYHLRSNNYTIQALIKYTKKNTIPNNLIPKLDKPGYKCIPSISELQNKSIEELKKVNNFKIYNKYGEVEFKEPINLLGIDLNEEIDIGKDMIETGDKLDYWSIFKIYDFIADENTISNIKEKLNQNGSKFISYKNNILVWEYKGINGIY